MAVGVVAAGGVAAGGVAAGVVAAGVVAAGVVAIGVVATGVVAAGVVAAGVVETVLRDLLAFGLGVTVLGGQIGFEAAVVETVSPGSFDAVAAGLPASD